MADLPYDSKCLQSLTSGQQEINIKSINSCRMETMYNTACMADKGVAQSLTSQLRKGFNEINDISSRG